MTASRESTHPNESAFPKGVSGPALRALHNAGVHSVGELATWTESNLAALHGMGPKALGILRSALEETGREFKRS